LTYALEMQNLLPEVDKAQIEEARKSAGYSGVGADFYLTPTPNMSAMLIGNYHVFEPFAFGSVGTVQYVTHAVTGRPFALKKMRRRNDHDRRAIENEIDILQKISHVSQLFQMLLLCSQVMLTRPCSHTYAESLKC
jgi:serine/threonine protein kinase